MDGRAGALAQAAFLSAPLTRKFTAVDEVTLGNTGIKTSRLAMGTGTVGFWSSLKSDRFGSGGAFRAAAEWVRAGVAIF